MSYLSDSQQKHSSLRRTRHCALSLLLSVAALGTVRAQIPVPGTVNGPIDVTTYAYDNARTGLNTQEGRLTPKTVNPTIFGRMFSAPVDGQIYAQPLYLHALSVPGQGVHNVVFVATEHDSVYAFDADGKGLAPGAHPAPLWHVSFINPAEGVNTVGNWETGSGDIQPEIGITGTPVIDPKTGTLYVVAKTNENGIYVQRLHALDVHTGNEMPNSPVVIQASVRGTGDGTDGNGNVPFNSLIQHNRSALLLINGTVYIAFASHGDNGPYHGWVLAYDAASLQQVGVWNATPNAVTYGYPLAAAGIWMGGSGPAADSAGNIYFATGNGTFDLDPMSVYSPAYGDAVVKLSTSTGAAATNYFNVADYFAPFNQQYLDDVDADLGSGGVLLLPDNMQLNGHKHLLIQAGKEGRVSLIDRDNMGKFNAAGDLAAQTLPGAVGGVWGKPSYFNQTIYFGGSNDGIRAFGFKTLRSVDYYYTAGFTKTSDVALNGSAALSGTVIRLTDGKNTETSSAFSRNRVNVQRFTTQFIFQETKAVASGLTFTLQGRSPYELGAGVDGLGYQNIGGSIAIKYDLVDHKDGQGGNTTGLYLNGQTPIGNATSLTAAGINLASGDPILVTISYDGVNLTVNTTDLNNNATSIQVYPIDIPTIIGAKLGFAGFTASTGTTTNATQDILAWLYYGPTLTARLLVNTGESSVGFGYPGATPTISAGYYNGAVTNAIVWAIDNGAWGYGGPSILYALDASNLGTVLYNSAATNESPGPSVKFSTPIVANGKVYVGSTGNLVVYGPRRLGPNGGGGQ